nr:hypothetical protein [Saccharopolyspora sp. HNM0983]
MPGATGGVLHEVEELRAACRSAVDDLVTAAPDLLVVVGGASATRLWSTDAASPLSSFARGSTAAPEGETLPLSLAVGRELTAGWPVELRGVRAADPVDRCRRHGRTLAERTERIGLLVMADGSARRGPKAPGYEHPGAAAVDRDVDEALRAGDCASILRLDPGSADELLIGGRAAWQVLAGACADRAVRARCLYSDDPFGVWYPVFVWDPDRAGHPPR